MKATNKEYIIYKVISPNNKIYIGITAESLNDRISKHLYQSKKVNTKFAKAIKKYGIKNLKWEIIKSNLSKDLAIRYESYFIKFFNSYKNGYNSTKGGEGAFGYKWDKKLHNKYHQQRIEKYYTQDWYKQRQSQIISNLHKTNPKLTEIAKNNFTKNRESREIKRKASLKTKNTRLKNSKAKGGKPFNVYDFITKTYIGTWDIQTDCCNELNLNNGKIANCLKGKRNFHKTYIFKYIDDPTVKGIEFNNIWLNSIKRRPNAKKS